MTPDDELTVPLDDMALDALEHAVNTCLTRDENDNWVPHGGEFTLSRLLAFWSGYDPSKSILIEGDDGIYEYPHPVLHEHDVIRALVAEVRRLRTERGNE